MVYFSGQFLFILRDGKFGLAFDEVPYGNLVMLYLFGWIFQ